MKTSILVLFGAFAFVIAGAPGAADAQQPKGGGTLQQGSVPAPAQDDLTQALIFYTMGEYPRAHALFSTLAEYENAVSQEILGRMYSQAEGVERNEMTAFKWFLKAATQGRTDAQFEAGVRYRDGIGTEQNGKLAMRWFKAAGERGAPHAFNALGELYRDRPDVLPDYAAALGWFLRGAQSDHFDSMFNIGLLYARGEGVAQDELEAYKWFERAYAAGHVEERQRADRARTIVGQRLSNSQVWAAKIEAADWFFRENERTTR